MHICGNIHGFIWESMTQNNCNTYLIDGSKRILVDPGHLDLFGHVKEGLKELGLELTDIDLVICTHAHPDHLEAAGLFQETSAQHTYHEADWAMEALANRNGHGQLCVLLFPSRIAPHRSHEADSAYL